MYKNGKMSLCTTASLLAWTMIIFPAAAHAQASNGSDGSFMPTVSTVLDSTQLVFNFSDFIIPSGVTVSFSGAASAQLIELLATGNIDIVGTLDGGANSLLIETPNNITLSGSLQASSLVLDAGTVDITSSSVVSVLGGGSGVTIGTGTGTGCLSTTGICGSTTAGGNTGSLGRPLGGELTLVSGGQISVIPEPETLLLLLTGLTLMGVSTQQRTRSRAP